MLCFWQVYDLLASVLFVFQKFITTLSPYNFTETKYGGTNAVYTYHEQTMKINNAFMY